MSYISDNINFSTVNASVNTAIPIPLPQGALNFYSPTMDVNVWYRYYDLESTNVVETSNFLRLLAEDDEQNGIIQKLSNLIIGQVYNINIAYNLPLVGSATLSIFSGTLLKSSHTLLNDLTQTIQFTASSTEDIIAINAFVVGVNTTLQIDSITITTPSSTIPYLSGFRVKPSTISGIGIVTFTDGINAVTPNQLQCESYGYTYNNSTGSCSIFTYNTNLDNVVANENNRTYGAGNSTQVGTNNTIIMGENNTVRGLSRNSIITGTQNQIANGVNNANISGTLGEATANNSLVLGCNTNGDALGERQNITVMYGTTTTDNAVVDSYLNNTVNSYFEVPINSILLFKTETMAVRVGGSAGGAVGDYKCWLEQGAIINKSGVLSISKTRTNVASSGTVSGIVPNVGVSGTKFLQQVKGSNNRDWMWATTIRLTQIKTGVTL